MFYLFTLISFIALYTTAFSFGAVVFQFINHVFPDVLSYGYGGGFISLRNAIAGLVVAFPLYVFLMRLVWKETKGSAQNLVSPLRKWFTYITLLGVSGVMLGDLIAVVSSALGGELAVRFVLKAGTIFAIAGSMFGYYLYDLKRKPEDAFSWIAKLFLGAASLAIAGSIAYGIVLTGTPGQQRALQLDQQRVSDLQQISYAIDAYWAKNNALPKSFDDLKGQPFYIQSVHDPKTGGLYEYGVLGKKTYELCAVFETSSSQTSARLKTPVPFSEQSWDHKTGRTCFQKEVSSIKSITP